MEKRYTKLLELSRVVGKMKAGDLVEIVENFESCSQYECLIDGDELKEWNENDKLTNWQFEVQEILLEDREVYIVLWSKEIGSDKFTPYLKQNVCL